MNRQQYFHWNVVRTYFWSPYTSQYFATVDKEIHCRERTWFHERLRRGTSVNRFLATIILKVHLHHHRKASFPHTWLEFIPFPGKKLILYDNLWLAFHRLSDKQYLCILQMHFLYNHFFTTTILTASFFSASSVFNPSPFLSPIKDLQECKCLVHET